MNKNIFKYNAYRKAASTLAALPEKVKSGDEAKKLPGIGAKIAKKIDEFLETGKLRKLEDVRFIFQRICLLVPIIISIYDLFIYLQIRGDENSVAINLLTRVTGIGPAKAKGLVGAGIKTIDDLKKNQDKLNHHQIIGLKYV